MHELYWLHIKELKATQFRCYLIKEIYEIKDNCLVQHQRMTAQNYLFSLLS